jgi:hypothetical protein
MRRLLSRRRHVEAKPALPLGLVEDIVHHIHLLTARLAIHCCRIKARTLLAQMCRVSKRRN